MGMFDHLPSEGSAPSGLFDHLPDVEESAAQKAGRILKDPEGGVLPAVGSLIDSALPSGGPDQGWVGDTIVDAARAPVTFSQGLAGLANLATGGAGGKILDAVGYNPRAAQGAMSEHYSDSRKQAMQELSAAGDSAEQKVADANGVWDTTKAAVSGAGDIAGAMLRNPSLIQEQVIQTLPDLLAGAGVVGGAAKRIAARGGEAALEASANKLSWMGHGIEGLQVAGQNAEQIRESDPDNLAGQYLQLPAGAVTGLIGRGASKIPGFGDAQTAAQLAIAGPKGAAKELLGSGGVPAQVLKAGISEGMFQELPQSAQEQIWQNVAEGKEWSEGVLTQGVQGGLTGFAMGLGMGGASATLGRGQTTEPGPAPVSQGDVDQANTELGAAVDAYSRIPGQPNLLGYDPAASVIDVPNQSGVGSTRIDASAGPLSEAVVSTASQMLAGGMPLRAYPNQLDAQAALEERPDADRMRIVSHPRSAGRFAIVPKTASDLSAMDAKAAAVATSQTRQQQLEQEDGNAAQVDAARQVGAKEVSRETRDEHTSIRYDLGADGHATVFAGPDGKAHIYNIQIGEEDSTTRGKGLGTKAYEGIGKALAAEGITLESTQWDKHLSSISPAALRVWEKLESAGLARRTGEVEGKVLDRFTGLEEVRMIPTFEFSTTPTRTAAPVGVADRTDAALTADKSQDELAPAPAQPVSTLPGFQKAREERVAKARAEAQTRGAQLVDDEAANVNTDPTDAQIQAGNYKKGHTNIGGLPISIENPVGSTRSGTDPNGKNWSVTMSDHYGYVKRTEGADGDQVDVYVKAGTPTDHNGPVYVVDQFDPKTGRFDEHKAMIGYRSLAEAQRAYDAHFSDKTGPKRRGAVTEMTSKAFKDWAQKGDTTAPASQARTAEESAQDEIAQATGKMSRKRGETQEQYHQRMADESNQRKAAKKSVPTAPNDVAAVRDALGDQAADVTIVADKDLPNADKATKGQVSKQAADFIRHVAKLFGKRVVFVSGMQDDGFYQRGNSVYLSSNSSVAHLRVFGHEMLHALKAQNRAAYDKMLEAVGPLLTDKELAAQHQDYFGKPLEGELDAKTRELLTEEWMADLSGNRFGEASFWENVFTQVESKHGSDVAKGVIAKLRLALINTLNKLLTLVKGNKFAVDARMGEHLEDIRAAIATGFADYAKAVKDGNIAEQGGETKFSKKTVDQSYQEENKEGVIVGARPGEFDWTAASGVTPPPIQHPTQLGPRVEKLGPAMQKILNSKGTKSLIEDLFGITQLQVNPTLGQFKGKPEPSFVLYGDGMTFEAADGLSRLLGFAFAQESTIVTQPVHAGDDGDTWPAYYVSSGKKLTAKEISAVREAAQDVSLDYTTSVDGTAFKFFFDGSDLEQFGNMVKDVAKAAGLKNVTSFDTRSQFNEAANYTQSGDRPGERQAWLEAGAAGSSSLFGRTVDHLLVPYAKAVGAEGYRFSPDLFAERFGLSVQQREYVRDALRPTSGVKRSTAGIVAGTEQIDVTKSDYRAKTPRSNITDIMWALQNRAAQTGLIEPGDYSDQAKKVISEALADEVIHHLERPGGKSAIGWYDAALKRAKEIYDRVFPELKENKDREMLFDALLGIASQGNDVHSNSLYAGRMYHLATRSGDTISQAVEKLYGTFGGETRAIENNFLKLEELVNRNGYDRMRELFNKKMTVGEWNAVLRRDESFFYKGEPLKVEGAARQKVNGWMVFGPKIGSFINNLHGDYSTLTADLWFSRTWNRILGFSFLHTPMQEAPKYQAFKDALIAEHQGATDLKANGKPWQLGQDVKMSDAELDATLADPDKMQALASELNDWYKKGFTFSHEPKDKKNGYSTKSDLRRAAKNWVEHREDSVAAPRNDNERAFQQDTVEAAQRIIKRKTGESLTIADIQAALWYHEKELFQKFGAGDVKAAPADYADAAKNFMDTYDAGQLFYVEKPTPRYILGEKGDYLKLSTKRSFDQVASLWTEAAQHEGLFQFPKSDKTDFPGVLKDIDPGLKVVERGVFDNKMAKRWVVHMTDGKSADVFLTKRDEVYVNASALTSEASRGAKLYAAMLNYAHNAGKVFIGDPAGVSVMATFRRTENMLSAALKFGTTKFMRPSTSQLVPSQAGGFKTAVKEKLEPVKWEEGNDKANLESLLHVSYTNISNLLPEIANVRYNFNTNAFEHAGSDRAVTPAEWGAMANRLGLALRGASSVETAASIGAVEGNTAAARGATLQRVVLSHSVLQETSRSGRRPVLDLGIGELPAGGQPGRGGARRDASEPSAGTAGQDRSGTGAARQARSPLEGILYSPKRFYSQLERQVSAAPDKVFGSAVQVKNWLVANAGKLGIKQEEIQWTGVQEWLDLQDKNKVIKADVLGYLQQNGVQVEEVEKGAEVSGKRITLEKANQILADKREGYSIEKHEGRYFLFDESGSEVAEEFTIAAAMAQAGVDTGSGSTFSPTKYGAYVLPGGENYRELLLTLPEKHTYPKTPVLTRDQQNRMATLNNQMRRDGNLPAAEMAEWRVFRDQERAYADELEQLKAAGKNKDPFRSAHWEEDNILAHVRFNDRTDAEGNKVLFIEELQSDWGQEGKKKGFGATRKTKPVSQEEFNAFMTRMKEAAAEELVRRGDGKVPIETARVISNSQPLTQVAEWAGMEAEWEGIQARQVEDIQARYQSVSIPAAPFVTDTKSWLSLGLKRMIAYAVENGYDKVAFVNGEQSADRYSLEKQVSRLDWKTFKGEKTGVLLGWDTNGSGVIEKEMAPSELEDHIGKELAERLVSAPVDHETARGREVRRLEGVGLKVGGEGMKAFYDKIVPQTLSDVLKKVGGGKVEQVLLPGTKAWEPESDSEVTSEGMQQIGFTITPALREKVDAGLPLFSLKRKITDAIDSTISKVDAAVDGLSNLPGQFDYLKDRYLTLGRIARVDEIGKEIREGLSKATPSDKTAVYHYLTTKGATVGAIQSPELKALAKRIKDTINYVGDELVARGLLDQASREKYRDQYLPRMYLRHMLDDQGFKAIGMGKKPSDLGYLKERKDIPAEIREVVLGEVKDPTFLSVSAIGRAMRDVSLLDWMGKISQNNDWVFPEVFVQWQGKKVTAYWLRAEADRIDVQKEHYDAAAKAKATALIAAMRQAATTALGNMSAIDHKIYKQIPDTMRYGLLRGMWIRKEIFDDIMGASQIVNADPTWFEDWFGFGGKGTRLTQWWKFSKVALNPPGQVRNFLSNMVMLQLSGVGLHKLPMRLMEAARDISNNGPYWKVAKKYGVTESTFTAQEMFRIKRDLLALEAQQGKMNSLRWLMTAGAHFLEKVSDLYQFSEALGKTIKIIDEMKAGKTEAEAALEAQKWLFDYSLVPQSVRIARNAPVGMPFLTYQVKVLPRLMEVAAKAPWRLLPWIGLFYGMEAYVASLFGVDDDELKKLKKSLPQWLQDRSHTVFLPVRDGDGRIQVADVGYFFPWTFYTQVGMHAGKGDIKKALVDDIGGQFSAPILGAAQALMANYDNFTHQPIYKESDPVAYQAAAIANYAYDLMAPPFISSHGVVSPMGLADKQFGGKMVQAMANTTNKFGDPKATEEQAIGALMGFNFYGMDPDHTRMTNLRVMNYKVQEAEKNLRARLMDQGLSQEQRADFVKDYQSRMADLQKEMLQYASESEVPEQLKVQKRR